LHKFVMMGSRQNGVLFCVGRGTLKLEPLCTDVRGSSHWAPLCADVRGLILSKLSLRDLARSGGTCRDFEEAYLARVAEERAKLVALGKEAYGEGMFCGIVRAVQRKMRGLKPFPCKLSKLLMAGVRGRINAAGEALDGRTFTEEAAEGPRSTLWSSGYFWRAKVEILVPRVSRAEHDDFKSVRVSEFKLRLSGCPKTGLYWRVWLGRKAPAPAVGLLLAICTENPETLMPCFQRPGRMKLHVKGTPWGRASLGKQAEEVIGPLGLLAELLRVRPPSHVLLTPPGGKVQALPRGVLKSVQVS
jgi:hypothetical protein